VLDFICFALHGCLLLTRYLLFCLLLTAPPIDYPAEYFDFSYDRDTYGDLIVAEIIDEEVGSNYVNGFVVLLPSQDSRDVSKLEARLISESNQIEVLHPTLRYGFLNHSSGWIGNLEGKKDKLNAGKLVKTLKSLVTRIKKGRKATMQKTIITFPENVSNEYFNPGAPEGVLVAVPLPYVFEHEFSSKKSKKTTKMKWTETVVMWRVYMVDSDRPFEESDAGSSIDGLEDEIGNFVTGN
jgi:hypothetical protein